MGKHASVCQPASSGSHRRSTFTFIVGVPCCLLGGFRPSHTCYEQNDLLFCTELEKLFYLNNSQWFVAEEDFFSFQQSWFTPSCPYLLIHTPKKMTQDFKILDVTFLLFLPSYLTFTTKTHKTPQTCKYGTNLLCLGIVAMLYTVIKLFFP